MILLFSLKKLLVFNYLIFVARDFRFTLCLELLDTGEFIKIKEIKGSGGL